MTFTTLFLLLLAGPLGADQATAGPGAALPSGVVSGFVLDASTRAPIESAQMLLNGLSKTATKVTTGPNGDFSFTGISSGSYLVSADSGGMLSGTRFVTLHEGESVKLRFNLQRTASITGRVVNEDGSGIAGIRVEAFVSGSRYGRLFIMPRGSAVTDDAGVYRIDNLQAGLYSIGIAPQLRIPAPGTQDTVEPKPVYQNSFYPDALSLADSFRIPINDGQQETGIDLHVRKANGYCMNATLPAWLGRDTQVVVGLQENGAALGIPTATGVLNGARAFHICGLPSGEYNLLVSTIASPGNSGWFGMDTVNIDRKNAKVHLELNQPLALKGAVTLDDKPVLANLLSSIGLRLEPVDRLPFADETTRPEPQSEGRISFARLLPGEYWVNNDGPPSLNYVAGISAGSRDGLRQPIIAGEGDLVVALKSDGAILSGIVTAEDGSNTVPDRGVILLANKDSGAARTTLLDQENKFKFKGLPPGTYQVLALFGIPRDNVENPTTFSRFLPDAQEVSLPSYSAKDIQLHPAIVR